VYTAELFAPLSAALVSLLRELRADDWARPTLAGAWTVRDVAAHLLDGDLRRLALVRDGHAAARPASPALADVVAFVNEINTAGVSWGRRLSPRLLTDLLERSGEWVARHVQSLRPDAEAVLPVAWADEQSSTNWMDTGREYTERWHHQMQIRDAVRAPTLLQPRWLVPLLELSVRAFRRAYRDVAAPAGTAVAFEVEDAGAWSVVREADGFVVLRGRAPRPAASVTTDPDTAWRLLYNALTPQAARERVHATGEPALLEPLLAARAVMV
jgi:uncharacterized protein (TIGR03083 family)